MSLVLSLVLISIFQSIASGCKCEVFENCSYGGSSTCIDDSGNVDSDWNDKISSIKVQSGAICTIYANYNYGGSDWSYIADSSCMKTDGSSLNDKTSSIKVSTYDTTCPCLLFTDCGWLGDSKCYTVPTPSIDSTYNDKFSAIIVGDDARCTLYENTNYDGKWYKLNNKSDACFKDESRNDMVSSIYVNTSYESLTGSWSKTGTSSAHVAIGGVAAILFTLFGGGIFKFYKIKHDYYDEILTTSEEEEVV